MTKPFIHVDSKQGLTKEIEVGTLMIYKEMPPMIVVVTNPIGEQVGEFEGTDIEAGIHTATFNENDFSIFEGTITLTQ